jgi:hypothetical protein
MRVEELVGKLAVRTKTVTDHSARSLFSMAESGEDCRYTQSPVFIEAVEQGVGYCRHSPTGEVNIIGAKYMDSHWAPVNERFYPKEWRGHFNPTPAPEAP